MFPVAGIDRLDKGVEPVEVVWFANSCDFIFDVARKSIVELAAEGSVATIEFGVELLKADNVFSNFLVITHFEPFKPGGMRSIALLWLMMLSGIQDGEGSGTGESLVEMGGLLGCLLGCLLA